MNTNDYIFINLLPYREQRKKERKKQFILLMSFFTLVAVFVLFLTYTIYSISIDAQSSRNDFISKQNKRLDEDIKAIANLRNQIRETLAKRRVVEDLQVNRSDSVGILNDISLQLPEGVTLKSISGTGNKIKIVGITNSNNKVSTYMTNLSNTSTFINPELVEVRASGKGQVMRAGAKVGEDQTLSDFTINVYLKPKQDSIDPMMLNNMLKNNPASKPPNINPASKANPANGGR